MRFLSSLQKVAHRGGAALAPENTLAAFRHALTLPIDAIELDVQMSRDGHAVVFHDENVERLTNGQGNMLDLDLAYLRSLNAAAHFAGGWQEPQRIPELREVLELARTGGVQVYIELKSSKRGTTYGRYPGIAEAVTREVLATNMLEQVLVISFEWELLPLVKMLAPGIHTGALVSTDTWDSRITSLEDLLASINALECEWVNIDYQLVTPDMPEKCHARGLRLGAWTVNDTAKLRALAKAEVDSLTTDRPDLFALMGEERGSSGRQGEALE